MGLPVGLPGGAGIITIEGKGTGTIDILGVGKTVIDGNGVNDGLDTGLELGIGLELTDGLGDGVVPGRGVRVPLGVGEGCTDCPTYHTVSTLIFALSLSVQSIIPHKSALRGAAQLTFPD